MFKLSDLLKHDGIVIQCHNIPDADTIASAFAVYTYLKAHGKDSKIIYSGNLEITKPNLLEMITKLSVPIEYIKPEEKTAVKTLVLVDCQYGERNAEKIEAETAAVIDHHVQVNDVAFGVISQLGSCATLVWDLARQEGFSFNEYPNVATALYYGLYTDTNSLEEISHPLDKDARDNLQFDANLIRSLRNNNLTLAELGIAGAALANHSANHDIKYAIFHSAPCDPNILGFISDLALQVSGIDVCVVYNELSDGYKLSVRSCSRSVMASEFTSFITEGVGSGGGHVHKAGGFIRKNGFEQEIESFMDKRIAEYFDSYDIIDSANHGLDVAKMKKYKKKRLPLGFVMSTDMLEKGTPMIIRTLEGDTEAQAGEDIYFMIGPLGEVYPIKAEKWANSYELTDEEFEKDYDYSPTVKNKYTGESLEIINYAKSCTAKGEVHIRAKPLIKNTKVFTAWNPEGYMYGKAGDMLAVRSDDGNDAYIIRRDIFEKTYEEVK
ncbi:MAG: DHH family phosphoesterase [Oscillospiraceae bacterium]|nr:DHH family phosphoesterase [Oscillospiraceae bacterium]